MADKNIQMTQRNSANTGWDNLYPETKAENVITSDGKTVDASLDEKMNKQISDDSTTKKYELGIKNGLLYYREVV